MLIANLSHRRKQGEKGKALLSCNRRVCTYDFDKPTLPYLGGIVNTLLVAITGRRRSQH